MFAFAHTLIDLPNASLWLAFMVGTVFTSQLAHTLRETLDGLHMDEVQKNKRVFPKWCPESKMTHAYEDYLEMVGPGLLAEKPEGTEIPLGQIREDLLHRFRPTTYALKIIITQEADEDCKYAEALDAGQMLLGATHKTMDYTASLLLARGFDTAFPMGDGLPVWSSAHLLAEGGTFSNTLATPMSPSRLAVIQARNLAAQMPDRDGTVGMCRLKKIVFPEDQWDQWIVVTKSKYAPEAGEVNAINVVESEMSLDLVPNRFWRNTTTNSCFITDAEGGFKMRMRRALKTRTWIDNDNEVMKYGVSVRFSASVPSNPRSTIGNQA
jgi:hypothetical protein